MKKFRGLERLAFGMLETSQALNIQMNMRTQNVSGSQPFNFGTEVLTILQVSENVDEVNLFLTGLL